MTFVAKDKGGDWCYVGDDMYHCIAKDGSIVGKIASIHVPDPMKLWESKCKQKNININDISAGLLRPNSVVFKLWEHANASSNA